MPREQIMKLPNENSKLGISEKQACERGIPPLQFKPMKAEATLAPSSAPITAGWSSSSSDLSPRKRKLPEQAESGLPPWLPPTLRSQRRTRRAGSLPCNNGATFSSLFPQRDLPPTAATHDIPRAQGLHCRRPSLCRQCSYSSSSHSMPCALRRCTPGVFHSARSSRVFRDPVGDRNDTPDTWVGAHSSEVAESHHAVYRRYAEHYTERFRASIDYQYAEKPRQVLCGFLFICFLIFLAFNVNTKSPEASIRVALLATLIAVLVYSFLQTRDGLLVRPHPGFWRIVHGLGIFHWLFMIILLVQTPERGRALLALIIPGVTTPDQTNFFQGTVDLDCRIGWNTIQRQLQTPWFASHVVGWLLKMCIFRHWGFCLIYSFSFEFLELSFQWIVPEFRECWWDSIILDMLGANVVGMLLGVGVLRWLNQREYDWSGQRPWVSKAVMRVLPFTWSEYHWSFYQTPERLLHAIMLLVLSNLTELNVFFNMYALHLRAGHWVHPLRLLYLCALGMGAVTEHYEYMTGNRSRMGHNAWLLVIIISVETLVCIKYGQSRFHASHIPVGVWLPWLIVILLFLIWSVFRFTSEKTAQQTQIADGENKVVWGLPTEPKTLPIRPDSTARENPTAKRRRTRRIASVTTAASLSSPDICSMRRHSRCATGTPILQSRVSPDSLASNEHLIGPLLGEDAASRWRQKCWIPGHCHSCGGPDLEHSHSIDDLPQAFCSDGLSTTATDSDRWDRHGCEACRSFTEYSCKRNTHCLQPLRLPSAVVSTEQQYGGTANSRPSQLELFGQRFVRWVPPVATFLPLIFLFRYYE